MKSFTDIEQSKKLAEILPIESADMYYTVCADEEDNAHDGYDDVRLRIENPFGDDELKKWYSCYEEIDWYDSPYVPCWSLAALLGVMPKGEGKDLSLVFGSYDVDYHPLWSCTYEEMPTIVEICDADDPIDVCVEMIYKLKEKELL